MNRERLPPLSLDLRLKTVLCKVEVGSKVAHHAATTYQRVRATSKHHDEKLDPKLVQSAVCDLRVPRFAALFDVLVRSLNQRSRGKKR